MSNIFDNIVSFTPHTDGTITASAAFYKRKEKSIKTTSGLFTKHLKSVQTTLFPQPQESAIRTCRA